MGTRTNINIQFKETNIWLYRHYDGYIEEAGYNLVINLAHSENSQDFLKRLLAEKTKVGLYSDKRDIYELTCGEHDDIEFLYFFSFTEKEVEVKIEKIQYCNFGKHKETILHKYFELNNENVRKNLKMIIDARNEFERSTYSSN